MFTCVIDTNVFCGLLAPHHVLVLVGNYILSSY